MTLGSIAAALLRYTPREFVTLYRPPRPLGHAPWTRAYSKPTLRDAGTVADLTRCGAGTSLDGRGQENGSFVS
jgi:hypothetical protein